jgi:pectinesterase
MRFRTRKLSVGLVAVFLTFPGSARGNDYFVNPTGANGAFTTVQTAINAVPAGTAANRTRIYIAPGTYTETAGANANLSINKAFITLIGQGASPSQVVIQNNLTGLNGSARVQSGATDLIATNLTFANTFGSGSQAVAFRSSADRTAIQNCRFLGYQDTLLADNSSRQYYRDCYVEGAVDFIFGNATAVFDHAEVKSVGGGQITAAETSPDIANGIIFLDFQFTRAAGVANNASGLGRPWHWDQGKIPSTLYIRSKLGPHIRAAGWDPWDAAANTNPDATSRYSEFDSADLNGTPLPLDANGVPIGRVSWADAMSASVATNYTLSNIFGPSSFWTASTQAEYTGGVGYTSQGAAWDPLVSLATVPEPAGAAIVSILVTLGVLGRRVRIHD